MLLHVPLGSQGHLHVTRSWQGNLAVNWKVAAKGMYIRWVQALAMFALPHCTWRLEGLSLHILEKLLLLEIRTHTHTRPYTDRERYQVVPHKAVAEVSQ